MRAVALSCNRVVREGAQVIKPVEFRTRSLVKPSYQTLDLPWSFTDSLSHLGASKVSSSRHCDWTAAIAVIKELHVLFNILSEIFPISCLSGEGKELVGIELLDFILVALII